ncbi:hypothetical protein TNCV_4857761 [Trichonephila clavipes]|nr:hypothetical protein TNCV_4857761 [Trichonephila clavipes]
MRRHGTSMDGPGEERSNVECGKILGVLNYTTSVPPCKWTVDAQSNLECVALETIVKSKRFKLYYVTVPTWMDNVDERLNLECGKNSRDNREE